MLRPILPLPRHQKSPHALAFGLAVLEKGTSLKEDKYEESETCVSQKLKLIGKMRSDITCDFLYAGDWIFC